MKAKTTAFASYTPFDTTTLPTIWPSSSKIYTVGDELTLFFAMESYNTKYSYNGGA